jgi:hypothetical protein
MFSSGDHGVGDGNPNPATQECITNDGRNVTRFIPLFPARYVLILKDFVCNISNQRNYSCPL